jgi:undecaprenyl-diphosphatase
VGKSDAGVGKGDAGAAGRPDAGRPVWQAIALGALHGPAELLPVSSSGHVTVIPWLAGWEDSRIDEELRKSFEVALHAGTAAALLISLRSEVEEALKDLNPRRRHFRQRVMSVALSVAPPAIVGYALERPIERRLGTPGTVAGGLFAGAVAMALADRAPQTRNREEADPADALLLGVAQACALIPGVSRNGATLAAARIRRFTRVSANRLSRQAALPVIAGATALKGLRLRRRGLPAGTTAPLLAGAGAAFVSTLGSTRLIQLLERDRSLLPYAVYRVALAAAIVWRLRGGEPAPAQPHTRAPRHAEWGQARV